MRAILRRVPCACTRSKSTSCRSSRTSYSKVSSLEIDFVSRSVSTRARVDSAREVADFMPHEPKSSRSAASSSAASSPMVVDRRRGSGGPASSGRCPTGARPGSGARKAASSPGTTASKPLGLHESEAIFAIIFPVATPALTVSCVARRLVATDRGRSVAARLEHRRAARQRRPRRARGPSTAWPRRRKIAKTSRETALYFCMSGRTTMSSRAGSSALCRAASPTARRTDAPRRRR